MTGYEVPKPPYAKSIDDCRPEIQRFARSLWQGTDDSDPESRGTSSTVRYINDLRWLDEWLDASGNELSEMEALDAETLMMDLSDTFNGSTPRQRWDQIMACCAYLARRDILDTNPLEVIDEEKADRGLTNTTEQSRQLGEEERYAVSQEEVRLMEDAVSSHRVRNQCIIRLMWQTGVRVGEVGMGPHKSSTMELRDIDREDHEVTIRESVAKNGKKRVIPYQESLDGLLDEWINVYRADALGSSDAEGPLFTGPQGGVLYTSKINEIVREAAINAGINRPLGYTDANGSDRWLITAHNLRHGYGNHMVQNTDAGLWEVSKMMGHSSVTITEQEYLDDNPRAGVDHGHLYGPD